MEKIQQVISWLRWGKLLTETKSIVGGHVSEYAVISIRSGEIVGYWAYGYFDPAMPYHGQPAFWS